MNPPRADWYDTGTASAEYARAVLNEPLHLPGDLGSFTFAATVPWHWPDPDDARVARLMDTYGPPTPSWRARWLRLLRWYWGLE